MLGSFVMRVSMLWVVYGSGWRPGLSIHGMSTRVLTMTVDLGDCLRRRVLDLYVGVR